MKTSRAIALLVIFLLQLGSANAQLGDLDMGLIKAIKSFRKKDPLESAQSNSTSQLSATDPSEKKPKDTPQEVTIPPAFEIAKQCGDIRFHALINKQDLLSINLRLRDVAWSGKSDDIDKHPYANYTLLAVAAENGCTNVVQQLIDNGVDVNSESVCPLSKAVENGHLEVVKMLLKAGALPDEGMFAACYVGRVDMLNILLEAGASGRGFLKVSIAKERLEILKTLLKLKTNRKNVDEHGYTQRPEFWDAIEKGNLDLIKAFLAEGEDVSEDRVNYNPKLGPQTLTQIAFKANKPEIIEYLKEARIAQLEDKKRQKALAAQKLAAESDALDKQPRSV